MKRNFDKSDRSVYLCNIRIVFGMRSTVKIIFNNIGVKVKCSHCRPGVAQSMGRGIVLLFHDCGTGRWVNGQQHAPAALYPREKDPVPILQEAGWAPGPVWKGGKISSPPGFSPGPSSP